MFSSQRPVAEKMLLTALGLLFFALPLGAMTSLSIPRMDIYTHGTWEDDTLRLRSLGDIEILLEGGVKLSGELGLRMRALPLEDPNPTNPRNFTFKNVGVTTHGIFGLPLDVDFFVGEKELLGHGASFGKLFSRQNFATAYSGHLYFNNFSSNSTSTAIVYEGTGKIDGTGIALSTDFGTDFLKTMIYTFQDNILPKGTYTSILRGLFDWENVKLETYLSASYPQSDSGLYGAGLMLYFRPAKVGGFYTQIGIPRWDPTADTFNLDLFYFLFEPRIQLSPLSVNLTFLLRPAFYLNTPTNEAEDMDVNLNLLLGQPEVTLLNGGLETTAKLNNDAAEGKNFFNLTFSPYIGATTSGVVWIIKFKYNFIKDEADPMFEGYIGVKAEL